MASTIIPTITRDGAPATKASPVAVVCAALVAGALFGFGLAWSTMIRPEAVLAFLRFQDLGLMLVMGGGVAVTFVAYQLGLGAGSYELGWAIAGIALGALGQGMTAGKRRG